MLNVAYISRASTGHSWWMKLNDFRHVRPEVSSSVDERLVEPHQLAPAVAGDVGGVVQSHAVILAGAPTKRL
jgi:hypothetical protein